MSTPSAPLIRLGVATSPGATGSTGKQRPKRGSDDPGGHEDQGAADITNPVNAHDEAISTVNDAKGIGSGRATLDTYLGAEMSTLSQLNKKIQGDRAVEEAVRDFSTIFSAHRVYLLLLPAARIAADADRVTTSAIPALTNDLDSQITTAANATKDPASNVLAS
jgi:hypothetical protein